MNWPQPQEGDRQSRSRPQPWPSNAAGLLPEAPPRGMTPPASHHHTFRLQDTGNTHTHTPRHAEAPPWELGTQSPEQGILEWSWGRAEGSPRFWSRTCCA